MLLISWLALDRLFNFSMPQDPDSYSDRANTYNMRLVGELSQRRIIITITTTTLGDLSGAIGQM